MRLLARIFFRGLLAFLPVFVTVYAVIALGSWLNRVTSDLLATLSPRLAEIPGLGIGLAVAAILVLGLLVSSRLTNWIYRLVESPLRHLPIIKELYIALKQLTEFLSPNDKAAAGQVVSVSHPAVAGSMIGLLMREDVSDLNLGNDDVECVAVYFPMSYQIGGFTVFVPRSWIRELDIPVETAIRETLTAWMGSKSVV